jgi:hypothetical protein
MKLLRSLALICTFSFIANRTVQAQSTPDGPSTDGLHCASFKWASDANSPHAAILVPISMDGQPYWYQLDTGADVVIAYGSAEHKGWIAKKDFTAVHNIQFAGMSLPIFPVFPMKQTPASKDVQGTVGLDIFVGHAFIIDFPKQRVCLLDRADMPDSLSEAASWTPAELRQGKLFIDNITLNGKPLAGVIYDSGTSPEELALDLPLWLEATGKKSSADATTHKFAQTWGQKVEYVTAKATGSLTIGDRTYPNALLTASPSRPTSFHDNVNGASGALGNALFLNSIVILDLGSHPEFGVVGPSKSGK